MEELDAVRERIRSLDEELAGLVADRIEAARDAGRLKRAKGHGVRDREIEALVVERMGDGFEENGLARSAGEHVARVLIGEALRVQESQTVAPSKGSRGRVLVVGGAGAMGSWLARFLTGLGYEVIVHDIAGPLEGVPYTTDLEGSAGNVDVVIVSTPPVEARGVLERLEGVDALVLDIASLKSPIRDQLERMAKRQRVASVHPLWGPNTRVLSDKNVLVLDCGNEDAAGEARALFEDSAANVVDVPLGEHDALMALTLGLPHAVNIVYADVLKEASSRFEDLGLAGGPTFLKQASVAAEVVHEDPELYRQIQALNEQTPGVYEALHEALDALADRLDDPEAFKEAMGTYRDTLQGYERWIHP